MWSIGPLFSRVGKRVPPGAKSTAKSSVESHCVLYFPEESQTARHSPAMTCTEQADDPISGPTAAHCDWFLCASHETDSNLSCQSTHHKILKCATKRVSGDFAKILHKYLSVLSFAIPDKATPDPTSRTKKNQVGALTTSECLGPNLRPERSCQNHINRRPDAIVRPPGHRHSAASSRWRRVDSQPPSAHELPSVWPRRVSAQAGNAL
jgi:hypothetical protein